MPEVLDFTSTQIKNASIQFMDGNTQQPGEKFGCMGTLESETETRQKTKNCEGTIEVITIPLYQTVTIGAHIKVNVLKNIFGLSNEGLKAGVRKYGINSKGKKFIFTADEIDEFGDVKKLIAYPNCSTLTGLSVSIDNDADEAAYIELEFRASPDESGEFYYDAFVDELTDQTVAENWHTEFNRTLIEEVQV
ncbi:phage tail protein [Senegalia massiliensis]|uniref:phage tail protein n=1 Tax=Senegalia massiliensis TaxID=1720316 RepID=UPI0010323B05|nr:phage tail protein [Senegalia massiliensis]